MRPPDWMDRAACKGMDPVLFFGPEMETPFDRDLRVTEAKAVCNRCPVRVTCLGWALTLAAQVGIAGGLTAQERTAERRRRQARRAS